MILLDNSPKGIHVIRDIYGYSTNEELMAVSIKERLKVRVQRANNLLIKIPIVQLIARTAEGAGKHDVGQRAAGVAYYSVLSIFPLLLGLIAVFGFFLPSVNLQDELLRFVGKNLPGAADILEENIVNIVKLRGAAGIVSIVILFGAPALCSAQ